MTVDIYCELDDLRNENESLKGDIDDLKDWVAQLVYELRDILPENTEECSARHYIKSFKLLEPAQRRELGLKKEFYESE